MSSSGSNLAADKKAGEKTGFGAQRKQVTLPTNFRSPPENGH